MPTDYEDLDAAYARAAEFDRERFVLWCEWANMIDGSVYDEDGDPYDELRRAALDHRGRP